MTNRFLWLHGFLAALPGVQSAVLVSYNGEYMG